MIKEKHQFVSNLYTAISLWNDHTNPAKLRTDFQHRIHTKAARKIMKYIRWNYGEKYYRFTESGRLLGNVIGG